MKYPKRGGSADRRFGLLAAVVLISILAASCATSPRVVREASESPDGRVTLYPGIEYRFEFRAVLRPVRIHVIRADLRSGSLAVRTPAAPDPDGEGPAESSLVRPVALARDSGALIMVNASAFYVIGPGSGRRPPLYRSGMKAGIAGLAVDSGRLVSPSSEEQASFYVDADGNPGFAAEGQEPERSARLSAAAAGFSLLVTGGTVVENRQEDLKPRTAVGLDAEGRLVMVVAEGRRKGFSEGLTLRELALLMEELGCVDALNLDGGGSCVLIVRDSQGGYVALNRPTDGFGPFRVRRPIPNALAVAPLP